MNRPSAEPRWVIARLLAAVVLVGVVAVLIRLTVGQSGGSKVERLRSEIAAELPAGSEREAVIRWFAARGWAPGTVVKDDRPIGLMHLLRDDGWLETAEIRIYFWFDDTGQLQRVDVDRFVFSF
jgi:hypothetical protein